MGKNENEDFVLDNLRSEVSPLRSIFRNDQLIRIEASDDPEFWIRPSGRALSEGALDRSRYPSTWRTSRHESHLDRSEGEWLWTILQGSICANRFVAGNASTQPDGQEQM